MKREWLVSLLAAALLLAGAAWLVAATEWTDVEIQKPPRGEAARDDFFAAQLLLRQLGARLERRQALDVLPPPGTRLLLASRYWDLFPERAGRLRRWVEDGGHLIVPASQVDDDALDWMPFVLRDKPRRETKKPRNLPPDPNQSCRMLFVPAGMPAPSAEVMRVCARPYWQLLAPRPGAGEPAWMLEGPDGIEFLRMPMGRGSVTAYGPGTITQNREVLSVDHALALAAALRLESGASVWLVTEEAREPFLAWLWNKGWPAVLLVLAAAAAWLWRAAVRSGPMGVLPSVQRRSMREQVAGTGDFLRHHGNTALHAAQLRALQETARVRLPGFTGLDPAAGRQAIARATGIDAAALARACQPGRRRPDQLPADLALLEAARRRLAGPFQPKQPLR